MIGIRNERKKTKQNKTKKMEIMIRIGIRITVTITIMINYLFDSQTLAFSTYYIFNFHHFVLYITEDDRGFC